jgi:tRNA nucleotidyltransferase/poly(A) polymerase
VKFGNLLDSTIGICNRLADAGFSSYVVGGAVRDLLMQRTPKEFDITTSATPEQVKELFPKTVAVGEAFGVVCVIERGQPFEVATFRQEKGYSDGRHPDSVAPGTLEHDLLRRDFTVNGLVLDPSSWIIYDYIGGIADLNARTIRAIGDPGTRLREDFLRTLRAVRFAAVLDFELDPPTRLAVEANAAGLQRISRERVRAELEKMAGAFFPVGLRLLYETGMGPFVLPFFPDLSSAQVDQACSVLAAVDSRSTLPHCLAALNMTVASPRSGSAAANLKELDTDLRGQAESLRLSADQRKATVQMLWLAASLPGAQKLRLARRVELYRSPWFDDVAAMLQARLGAGGTGATWLGQLAQERQDLPDEQLYPPTLVTGKDLIAMGVAAGPQFKLLLQQVEDLVVEGQLSDREEALAWLKSNLSC